MTKIIIVGPASPLRGGISDFNEALAKSLTVKGYLVEIISFSYELRCPIVAAKILLFFVGIF